MLLLIYYVGFHIFGDAWPKISFPCWLYCFSEVINCWRNRNISLKWVIRNWWWMNLCWQFGFVKRWVESSICDDVSLHLSSPLSNFPKKKAKVFPLFLSSPPSFSSWLDNKKDTKVFQVAVMQTEGTIGLEGILSFGLSFQGEWHDGNKIFHVPRLFPMISFNEIFKIKSFYKSSRTFKIRIKSERSSGYCVSLSRRLRMWRAVNCTVIGEFRPRGCENWEGNNCK